MTAVWTTFGWLMPIPSRNLPGKAWVKDACISAVARAGCVQMLTMPVATTADRVAPSILRMCSPRPACWPPGNQRVVYPSSSSSAAAAYVSGSSRRRILFQTPIEPSCMTPSGYCFKNSLAGSLRQRLILRSYRRQRRKSVAADLRGGIVDRDLADGRVALAQRQLLEEYGEHHANGSQSCAHQEHLVQRADEPELDRLEQGVEELRTLRPEVDYLLPPPVGNVWAEQDLCVLELGEDGRRHCRGDVRGQRGAEPGRELVRQQAAKQRHPDRAADRTRELRQRGHHTELVHLDRVLRRQREHRHGRTHAQADDDHVADNRQVVRVGAHAAQQVQADGHPRHADQAR